MPPDRHAIINESIKEVLALSSRIDERVQEMVRVNETIRRTIEHQAGAVNTLVERVAVIEARKFDDCVDKCRIDIDSILDELHKMKLVQQALQSDNTRTQHYWRAIIAFIIQIIWVVTVAAILYKLGLEAPP